MGNQRLAQHSSGQIPRRMLRPSRGRAVLGVPVSPRPVPTPRLGSEGSGSMTHSVLVWDHHDGMVIPTTVMGASITASPCPAHLMFHSLMVTKEMVYEINQV